MNEGGTDLRGRTGPASSAGARPSVIVVEKQSRWGPRLLAGAGVLAAVATVLLARWIPASPLPDGRPWHISGQDWLACRRHDRSMGTPGAPDFKPGVSEWRLRLEREPGSFMALRGYLDSLLGAADTPKQTWREALDLAKRLPPATGTNSADVGRLLRASLHVTDRGDEWRVAGGWAANLAGPDLALYLATAADHGDWDEVGRVLSALRDADGPGRMARRALAMRKDGKEAGPAPVDPELLKAAGGTGEEAVAALRWLMACAVERSEAGLASEALAGLRRLGAARLMDYLWEDALRRGDTNGANEGGRTRDWPEPVAWREVRPWVRWLRRHGETARAKEALQRAALAWDAPSCWIETTALVLEAKDWDLAEQFGDRFVAGTRSLRDWDSLGHALRALALEAKGDAANARLEWERMARTPMPRHGVAMDWCRAFDRAGRLSLADSWLRAMEGSMATDPLYWRMRMRSAMAAGDTESWMAATARAAQLAPGDVDLALDRAWGVLALGRDTEEVLALLQDDAVMLRGGRRGQVLAAWAEARLGRTQKAENLLRLLDPLVKDPTDRSIVAVAWFEALNQGGRIEEAWKAYRNVDLSMLPAPIARKLDREGAALAIRVEQKRKFDEALEEARRRP